MVEDHGAFETAAQKAMRWVDDAERRRKQVLVEFKFTILQIIDDMVKRYEKRGLPTILALRFAEKDLRALATKSGAFSDRFREHLRTIFPAQTEYAQRCVVGRIIDECVREARAERGIK